MDENRHSPNLSTSHQNTPGPELIAADWTLMVIEEPGQGREQKEAPPFDKGT
jgi:hypothetical protein